VVHGHQQLSLLNAHFDERFFLPIQLYDADSGHCVVVPLPHKTAQQGDPWSFRRLIRRIAPILATEPDHHPRR
jgi:hypothetical protein